MGASVTSRALAVLDCFDERCPRLTLSELSRRADLPLSTAHRLVGELVAWRALVRREDGRYEIGPRIWELGLLARVNRELREIALPFLQDLAALTGENVHLAVRDGHQALYVDRISGSAAVPVVSRAGARLPLHATGVGKVLLAYAPQDLIDTVLSDLRPVTTSTIISTRRMRQELEQVRRRRFARTVSEMSVGTTSVAVPVLDTAGEVVASLGAVLDARRPDYERLVPALHLAASGISRLMS